ncbi:MAG: ATP-binding cassette domain-containing protein, partial [Burkholderiales bacterium]
MAQYVYTMRRVSKTVPPKRTILKNISLNFFPGAKIGVLGLNGSGKSSLLKIMAGADDNYEGEVVRMPNIRVGYLEQEPLLKKSMTVREAVEESMGETAAAKKRLEEIYAAYSEPDADFDKLAEEQGRLEALVNAGGADEMEVAADALRLPPWEQKVDVLSGGEKRRVALCR